MTQHSWAHQSKPLRQCANTTGRPAAQWLRGAPLLLLGSTQASSACTRNHAMTPKGLHLGTSSSQDRLKALPLLGFAQATPALVASQSPPHPKELASSTHNDRLEALSLLGVARLLHHAPHAVHCEQVSHI